MFVNEVAALSRTSPVLLSAAAFLAVVFIIQLLLQRFNRLAFPVIGDSNSEDDIKDLLVGTSMYPDIPFILPHSPPLVILPISCLEEVRNLPESKASFIEEFKKSFLGKYTGIGTNSKAVFMAIKKDLTPNIANTLDALQDEIKYAFDKELGPCEDWTCITVVPKMLRAVALLSGRVFVGRPFSRDEEWITSSIMYTIDVMGAREAILKYPIWFRPLVAPFLPEVRGVKKYKTKGAKALKPVLMKQLARVRDEKTGLEDPDDEQGTSISWLLKYTEDQLRSDPVVLGENQIQLSFAAIHTTTQATTHAIYDLACRPEYVQPLRDEIEQVIAEEGLDIDSHGIKKLKKSSLPKLKKLDSFLKESQRMSPPGLISNLRLTKSPITLSTGHTLPKGTRFALASYIVQTSPSTKTYSPAYNPPSNAPPTEFDGFRFYNLRSMPGKESKHQYVTTSADSLNFGHGNHACLGRFFAANEIEVAMIELLRNWEFRLKGDVEGRGGVERRPRNLVKELTLVADPSGEIEFKRRGRG